MTELPFYYSFKEFAQNYSEDLKKWLNTYTDAEEHDFLTILSNNYCFEKEPIQIFIIDNEYPEKVEVDITDFVNYLVKNYCYLIELGKSKNYISDNFFTFKNLVDYDYFNGYPLTEEDLEGFEEVYDNALNVYRQCNTDYNLYYYNFFRGFIVIDDDGYLALDMTKYENYFYAQSKIQKLIKEKITNLSDPKEEIDFETIKENNVSISKFSKLNQEQVSLLGRLIYENFYNNNKKQSQKIIAKGLSTIFGFSEKNIINKITGQNYLDNFKLSDIEDLKNELSSIVEILKTKKQP